MSESGRASVPRTLEEFRRHVTNALAEWSHAFRSPTDDWHSLMLWVQNDAGIDYANVSTIVTRISGGDFTTTKEKDLASVVVRNGIAAAGAYRYALVTNGHTVMRELTDEEARRREAGARLETLGAVESLTMAIGDAEDEQVWEAMIVRDLGGLRRVGSWCRSPFDEGRFLNVNDRLRAPRRL